MDRYHSIVGPMVSYHWKPSNTIVSNEKTIEKPSSLLEKPLENHWYQWLARPKPLKNHCYQWFARPKTIEPKGCFPTIHSTAQVSIKTLECCNYKANKSCVGIANNLTINIIKYLKLAP